MSPGEGLRFARCMPWRSDTAQGNGHADGTEFSCDHVLVNGISQPFGGNLHRCFVAGSQDDAEFVSRQAANQISGTQFGGHDPGDRSDDMVGDIIAVGVVDDGEIIDARDKERTGRVLGPRLTDGAFQAIEQRRQLKID